MVIVHETLSYCALQLHEFRLNSFNGCPVTNDQREITPKYTKQSNGYSA